MTMTQEQVQRMYGYMEQHLSPDLNGHILAEKMGSVILSIGDALEATKAELAQVKEQLAQAKKRPAKKTAKKRPSKVKKPMTIAEATKILGLDKVQEAVSVNA